ncbi:MAG TPA: hypothetical protein VH482_12040 [Thermomicrobiales bacterium]
MSQLQMAMLLLVVVVTVLAATRPSPPRRRRGRAPRPRDDDSPRQPDSRRPRTPAVLNRRSGPRPTADPINRNRWDRTDIAAGVGRDHADPDLTLWPAPR